MERWVDISDCGTYRYRLWRQWNHNLPSVLWVMLNPSTADDETDDATIRKCVGFAKRWGCGGIEVVNLFAFRATDPRELSEVADPVGPRNSLAIRDALAGVGHDVKIVAWGGSVKARQMRRFLELRARRFREEVGHHGFRCLGTTKFGQPRHPLMLAYATPRIDWPLPS